MYGMSQVFARHPESANNARAISCLDAGDPPLTELGIYQAHETGKFCANSGFEALVISPTIRTRQAADIIIKYANIPIYEEAGLTEFNWGSDAGRPVDEVFTPEVEERACAQGMDFRVNPQADTIREAHRDVTAVLQRYAGRAVLPLTHNFKIKSWLAGELNLSRGQMRQVKIPNAAVVQTAPLLTSDIVADPRLAVHTLFLPSSTSTIQARRSGYGQGRSNDRSRARAYA